MLLMTLLVAMKMQSTQENVACSKNIAYANPKQANKDDSRAFPTTNKPVYDEVSPKN